MWVGQEASDLRGFGYDEAISILSAAAPASDASGLLLARSQPECH